MSLKPSSQFGILMMKHGQFSVLKSGNLLQS